eukprot:2727824-Amphidinium_carterae.1
MGFDAPECLVLQGFVDLDVQNALLCSQTLHKGGLTLKNKQWGYWHTITQPNNFRKERRQCSF